jgi:hypothetical protein
MPYQPTVTDRTGEFLFRGITGAADSLAEGIRTWKKNKEESAGAVTALEGFGRRYGTDTDFAGRYGDKLAKAPGMSLSQQKALLGDLTLYDQQKRQQQEQANKDREYNLSKVYADLQQGQMNRANERDAAGQRFMGSLAELVGDAQQPSMDFANTLAGEPGTGEVSLAKMIQAGRNSGIGPDQLATLAPVLRAEQMGQRGGRPAPEEPRTVTLGDGTKVMWNPTTGKSEVLRDQPDANTVPARERLGAIKAKLAALTKQGRPLGDPKAQAAYDAKLEALFSQLDGFSGGGNPAADAVVGGGNSAFESELNDLLKRKR